MEFLQLLMLFVAVMLIWFRPANEKLAWCLTIVAWFSVVVNFQRFSTLEARRFVNAPKMSAHHRGIYHF